MEKVYVVFKDSGSWDSHNRIIDKIFLKEEDAEQYVKQIENRFIELKKLVPIDKSDEDDFDMTNYENYNKIYLEECSEFRKKYGITEYDVREFNKCLIEEFEIN